MVQICTLCHENPSKYKCPACGALSCSLNCVRKHKSQSNCPGTVSPEKYVSSSNINENGSVIVQRDYNFLLKVGRNLELAKTDTYKVAKPVFYKRRGRKRGNDVDITAKGSVTVIQVSLGMQRSRANKTYFDKNRGGFYWTVEIIFVGGAQLVENRVFEEVVVGDLVKRVEKNIGENIGESIGNDVEQNDNSVKNKDGSHNDGLNDERNGDEKSCQRRNIFLKVYKDSKQPLDHHLLKQVDDSLTLKEILKDQIILEFPTIYISEVDQVPGFTIVSDSEVSDSSEEDSSEDSSDEDSCEEERDEKKEVIGEKESHKEKQEFLNNKEDQNEEEIQIEGENFKKVSHSTEILLNIGYNSDSEESEEPPVESSAASTN